MALTVAQYTDKAISRIQQIIALNRPFELSVRTTVARQAVRIFVDGIKSDGSPIGQYNTTRPMYINPDTSSPRAGAIRKKQEGMTVIVAEGLKPTRGKAGEHIFKNGRIHRTTYVNNYKDFRNRIGRRIDRVNYTLTGDLMRDFCNAKTPARAVPKKISEKEYRVVLKREANIGKREGLEKKFGTTFRLMASERAAFFKTLDFNFRKALAAK